MDLKYPIGRLQLPSPVEMSHIQVWITEVWKAPTLVREAVQGLNDEQLDTPYRPEGWTVRQVVHHLADSHMHTYLNFRLALTEDRPLIRPTDVDAWTNLADCRTGNIQPPLEMLDALHRRWGGLMQTMTQQDFMRTIEVQGKGERSLAVLLGIYAWHGKHHAAHITSLRERMGW